MQTWLSGELLNTPAGQEADAILRSCVHCGFCTAACPTYRLSGNELDSPRGRIYQIKSLMEGEPVSDETQLHLDRCLTCRACETACPSGVEYGRLVDIGRQVMEEKISRPWQQRLLRKTLRFVIPSPMRFKWLLNTGRLLKPMLPNQLKRLIPDARPKGIWPLARHQARVLVLSGCVQPLLEPGIDSALARVLDQYEVSAIRLDSGCCGAVSHHLNAQAQTMARMKANIDAIWPHIESGIQAIVTTASGCGAMLHEYGHLLRHDAHYAQKAKQLSALCRDPIEIIESLSLIKRVSGRNIAFHSPCSLQHALKLEGRVEALLSRVGFTLLPVTDSAVCCGSAGTYSILQPKLSGELKARKLQALQQHQPELIATANIGCLTHLNNGSKVPVVHWLSLLAE